MANNGIGTWLCRFVGVAGGRMLEGWELGASERRWTLVLVLVLGWTWKDNVAL